MVGDVNLFLNNVDNRHCAEIEVMIAEPSSRGKGLGLEATVNMMYYGESRLNHSTPLSASYFYAVCDTVTCAYCAVSTK